MTTADVPSEDTTVTFADLPEEVLELVFSLFSKTTAAVACSVNQKFYSLLKPLCACFKELKRIHTHYSQRLKMELLGLVTHTKQGDFVYEKKFYKKLLEHSSDTTITYYTTEYLTKYRITERSVLNNLIKPT